MNHHQHDLIECKTLSFHFGNRWKKLNTYMIPHRLLNKVVTGTRPHLHPPYPEPIFLIVHPNVMQNEQDTEQDKETNRN